VEILPSCRPEPMPISIVYPSGRLLPARVRVAIEALDALRRRLLPARRDLVAGGPAVTLVMTRRDDSPWALVCVPPAHPAR